MGSHRDKVVDGTPIPETDDTSLCNDCRGPLTKAMLDKAAAGGCQCGDPSCGIIFRPSCHPRAGTWTKYLAASGLLEILCAECDAQLETITFEKETKHDHAAHCDRVQ